MQSPRSFRRHLPLRWLTILTVVALATAALVSPAAAGPPVHSQFVYTIEGDLIDVCTFTVHVDATANVAATFFSDNSGTLVRSQWHLVEQDTFSANGKTLVSLPYPFNGQMFYDSSGNPTQIYTSGVSARVPLPDGGTFFSAGRIDWANHPNAVFVINPDHGHSGNLDAFCAALAP